MSTPTVEELREVAAESRARIEQETYERERAEREAREEAYKEFRSKEYTRTRLELEGKILEAAQAGEQKGGLYYSSYGYADQRDKHWARLYSELRDEYQKDGFQASSSSETDEGTGSDPGPPIFSTRVTVSWEKPR